MITYGLTFGIYAGLLWNEVDNILLNGFVMPFLYALTYLYSIELFKED